MPADLTAASRNEYLVLHDPAAIPADTPVDPDLEAQEPRLLPAPAMMELAARGEALVLHIPEEDCEARFRVFVDEEPPEDLRSKGQVLLEGARLLVPSGLLRADGLEFLCRPGESRSQSEPEEAAVARGEYALEVVSLLAWKAENRIAEGRRGIGRMHQAIDRLVFIYTFLGAALIPAHLFVAPLVLSWYWQRGRWRGVLTAGAVILCIDAVVLGGFWLLDALKRRHPDLFRVMDADAAFEAANPDVVVVLRTSNAGDGAAAPAYAKVRSV